MEGPLNGHIYATVNSIKTDSELEMMKSPSSNAGEGSSHRSSHGHHYAPQRSPHVSLSPRPNTSHSKQHSDSDPRFQPDNVSHPSSYHASRKPKEHDQNYHQTNHDVMISKRVAPMWSPNSDISASYQDPPVNSVQRQVAHRSATQAEIDKLDDLLQELTPRLNDSPSEYSRRRRQSFSSSGKTGAYEGRHRQDTFIQGFSPTSPVEAQDKGLSMSDSHDQQQMMLTASIARAPLVERSNSQSNLEMMPRQTRNSSWHSEEKKRLQRTRSLLDEKDKYLTEQLRRIQARTGGVRDYRDTRDGSGMSPIGPRPGSSQQILGEMVARYNNSTGRDYVTAADWDDVRLFADQHSSNNTRRANSEMDYPLRDLSVDRRNNSPVVGVSSRRKPLIRHNSDRDEFLFMRQRHNSDNPNRSYSPIGNYRHLNGSPAHSDIPVDITDDIPLMQRRNIRTNLHSSRLASSNVSNLEAGSAVKINRNIESLPMSNVSRMSGHHSPISGNMDLVPPGMNVKEAERSRATPEILNKTRSSGFQIRADNSTRASGISYHDPDEAYLSSDSYPIVSRLTLSQSPSEQQQHSGTKMPVPSGQRRNQHGKRRSEDLPSQSLVDRDRDRDRDRESAMRHASDRDQEGHHSRALNSTAKPMSTHNSHNSSLRKSAKIWYQPTMSREEAVKNLKGKPPGSFVVRQSHTFNNSYGLAVKVPRNISVEEDDRCVRHFLIESNSKGVRIRGCSNEPYFGSLTALVHQHTLTKLALPCCLHLPVSDGDGDDQQSQFDSCNKSNTPKTSSLFAPKTFVALYLGSIDTESLTGAAALNKAVEILLENKTEVKQAEVSIRISPEGLTLTDVMRKLFFRRHYPLNSISYCGTENTAYWDTPETRSRGISKSRIFGVVARKTGTTENMCHLLCEWHPQDNARTITNFLSCCVPGT